MAARLSPALVRRRDRPSPASILPLAAMLLVTALAAPVSRSAEPATGCRWRQVVERQRPLLEERLAERGLELGSPVFMRIFKESENENGHQGGELEVWIELAGRFVLFASYPICTYSGTLGPKIRQGDRQSPEGFYYVKPSHLNPCSTFHLSFDLGYPNAFDRAHQRTGSYLMVHGNCVSIGCYAMTDPAIEEIYTLADQALRAGQSFFRVHVFPFRMTAENLARRSRSRWRDFWSNLKQGYDHFESKRRPPNVTVADRKYVFADDE
jgi:murein L,D-transpeptidase YafK